MIVVQHSEKSAIIYVSQGFAEMSERAFCGEDDKSPAPEMVTQSLLQSKDLITSNTKQASESPDSLALCVGGEGKKQRVGFRLTIAERQSLELAAKQNNMKLSNWLRQLAQNSAHQKSA